jgi:quercetin dioxygenase-like cupin family protein
MIICDSFVIADWTAAEGTRGQPIAAPHRHRSDDEAWYVLDGRLGFTVDERELEVESGGSILVPRNTWHTYWNASDGPTHYLLVMTPRIHQLIEALHRGDRGDYARIFEEHDSELLQS